MPMTIETSRAAQWRQQYAFRRYLRDMPLSDIEERTRCIVSNMIRVENDGRVGLLPLNSIAHLSELFIHVQEEHKLRKLAVPQLVDVVEKLSVAYISLTDFPIKFNMDETRCELCKFTHLIHAKSLVEKGELLISPGSCFNEKKFNRAIRDNELESSSFLPRNEVTVTVQNKRNEQRKISPLSNIKYGVQSNVEFYISCFSVKFKPRLFVDLEYDACVLIKDKVEFENRLYKSALKHLPTWCCNHASVSYHDEILGSFMTTPAPYFSKGLCYQYQEEYRYAWLPKQRPSGHLGKILLTLGSLKDIAEVVTF